MAQYLGKTWTKEALRAHVGQMEQLAGIRASTLSDGPGRGVRVLELYTGGGLQVSVVPDRGLDLTQASLDGLAVAWTSAAGVRHPSYFEPENTGWLRNFAGGLMTTCGLEQAGAASVDQKQAFGLHGRISNEAAQEVSHRCYWQGDAYLLEITGKVRQASLFAENLLLERRISAALGSNTLRVEDKVTNEGFRAEPHMLLYHCNLGFPLISQASTLDLPSTESAPRDAEAEKGFAVWQQFQAPTAGYLEQVFRHKPPADEGGWATIGVRNPEAGLALTLRYDTRTLPYLYQWKLMGMGEYVLGLEPINCAVIQGRAAARKAGELKVLEPGESCHYTLEFTLERFS